MCSRNRFVFGCQRELIKPRRRERVIRKVVQRQHRHRHENVVGKFGDASLEEWPNNELRAVLDGGRVCCAGAALRVDVVDAQVLPVVQPGRRREVRAKKPVLHSLAGGRRIAGQRQQQRDLARIVEQQRFGHLEAVQQRVGRMPGVLLTPAHNAITPAHALLAG